MKKRVHVCKLRNDSPDRDLSKSDNQHSRDQQHPPRHPTIIEGKNRVAKMATMNVPAWLKEIRVYV